jgi:hypothetical protein
MVRVSVGGTLPPEQWNRLGTKLLPKLKSGGLIQIDVGFSVEVSAQVASALRSDLGQILQDLDLQDKLKIDGN